MDLGTEAWSVAQDSDGVGPVKKSKLCQKQVLVVTDMQKDYDIGANTKMYGEVRSPYANDISKFVPNINRIRRSTHWDRVVFTLDWLEAELLAGRTPFCMENTVGAELLDDLEVKVDTDVFFKKNSDDSFCLKGGRPEHHTKCSTLGEVLGNLGFNPTNTALVFVGQRFERCVLKTVMHARDLGYESSIVDEATYTKTQDPDPEWNLDFPEASPTSSQQQGSCTSADEQWASDIYLRARKAAGRLLAETYLRKAGVRILDTWPEPRAQEESP
eukprot:TRINITY_DN59096_c0_g1_i1.p1 TRINITY_DN59096_c0_g1~~TRINITY_DN59096_c0_g1_i1.p1  ORF type:complete len:288 (+),score=39.51 TRINITY_DN59096_c0_g1_i1:50-865(+)